MASHTEPAQQHTKDELMHPGRDHHLSQGEPCPDPSVHRNTKLQEQASTAALYATSPSRNDPKDGLLDANNKLSSRSAATSLKYAQPRDLPSFPVVGINTTGSANKAANLANTNQKPFEHWKPEASSAAGKAAMLAKDYKMDPLWKPESSAAGSKAALLAHRDGGKLNLWMPEPSAEGNSAAGLAMRNKTLSPQLDYGYTDDGRKRALVAATGAINRSKSNASAPPVVPPPAYPDSANSAHNALNAATVANRPSSARNVETDSNRIDSDAMRAARVQNIGANFPRQAWGEHPSFKVDVEEKQHQDALRASAISMAKTMYTSAEKRRKEEDAAMVSGRMGLSAATSSHANAPAPSSPATDVKSQALQYIHLQEAAQRLAKERLDKMDPDGVARYRAHYGYDIDQNRSRMSMRGRARRRADSDAQTAGDSSDDEMQARRIRNQMSGLNNSVAQTDAKKQQKDRAALLAAAERKVQAQMQNMDEKVFRETGKVSPAMMEEWEAKARARATADSEVRQKNFGKIDIGGGRFMDQSELEAIAQSRLQPTLDKISATAEQKRARDEEIRLEQEEKKREEMTTKQRDREVKAEQQRLRDEEKAAAKSQKAEEKAAAKARKEEQKRGSKTVTKPDASVAAVARDTHLYADKERPATGESAATETPAATTEVPEITRTDTAETGIVDANEEPLRPELERHVSTILTSDSEVSSIAEHEHVIPEETREVNDPTLNVAERVMTAPVEHVSTRTEPAVTTSTEEPATTGTTEPAVPDPVTATKSTTEAREPGRLSKDNKVKRKSFGGFFNKFKRTSKPPTGTATEVPAAETDVAKSGTAVAAPPTTAAATGTAATATATADSDSLSSSSFRRHEADLHSISSLSSSDAEADTRTRTRRGRSGKTSTEPGAVTDNDEDEFEEARDHFDESLAPPPTFGGQAKTTSPVRETKFSEVL
ncbi:hypothetical protein MBLNU459_g0355t1 [Dothideomycetes sp. NU459]